MPDRPTLASVRLGQDAATRTLVMLHGIYGRGRNWQGIARALIEARPAYACVLVDLPWHGASGPGRRGAAIADVAADLDGWLRDERIVPDAVLGHSYGGKVALALAAARREADLQLWIIDSTPESKPPSGSAWQMLEIVRGLPARFASRDEAVDAIVAGGFAVGVAQWMATNLERSGEEFVWGIDFDAMERLMRGFFEADLWPAVDDPAPRHELHFLKASESSAISPGAVQRLAAAPADRVHLHVRAGGHWIHAERPDVVVDLLVEHLP